MTNKRSDIEEKGGVVRTYYQLAKPGIIRGNAMTAVSGFLYASRGSVDVGALILFTIGIIGLIGGACVANNILDVRIDSRMKRTKERALVTGKVSTKSAAMYATVLVLVGFLALALSSNVLTFGLGALAVIWYVALYGYAKRATTHSTLIGTVPGALPLVAGYTAVTGHFDLAALVLFLIMVTWQMPHFYAIAIYRMEEYTAAKLPILSVQKGTSRTKQEIVIYTWLFAVSSTLLYLVSETSLTYLVGVVLLSAAWLWMEISSYGQKDINRWAKKVFGFSLLVLLGISLLLSLDFVLP